MLAVYVISALLVTFAPSATDQEAAPDAAQAPAPAPAASEAPAAEIKAAERRARRERQVICENRPRTGSTLNRPHCQTRQMAQTRVQDARDFVRESQERIPLDGSLGGPK